MVIIQPTKCITCDLGSQIEDDFDRILANERKKMEEEISSKNDVISKG